MIVRHAPHRFTEFQESFIWQHYPTHGGGYCAGALGLRQSTVRSFARSRHLKELPVVRVQPSTYQNIQSPEFVYTLGFLWADGNVPVEGSCVRMSIVEDDGLAIQNKLIKHCGFTMRRWTPLRGRPQILFRLHDRAFHDWLVARDYAVKSWATPTKVLADIPVELRHYFWRGLFDGDGCFHIRTTRRGHSAVCASLTGSFTQDWSDFLGLLDSLSVKYGVEHRQRAEGNNSSVRITRKIDIRDLGNYLYQGYPNDGIGLPRKFDKWQAIVASAQCAKKTPSSRHSYVTFVARKGFWAYDKRVGDHRLRKSGFKTEDHAHEALQIALGVLPKSGLKVG